MSIFVSFGIIILAAIIHAFFQLNLGGLILLYHSSQKSHIAKKTRVLATNFILGTIFMLFLGLATSAFVILTFFGGKLEIEFLSLLVGLLLVLSIVIWGFYYRSGQSTELWLPRSVSRFITSRLKNTSSRIEAFSLGMLTCLAEFPFSFVLIFLASNFFLDFSPEFQLLSFFLYIFIAVLPLLICRLFVRKGKTVADIQKWRTKYKSFLRFLCGVSFLILALFVFVFKILGEIL